MQPPDQKQWDAYATSRNRIAAGGVQAAERIAEKQARLASAGRPLRSIQELAAPYGDIDREAAEGLRDQFRVACKAGRPDSLFTSPWNRSATAFTELLIDGTGAPLKAVLEVQQEAKDAAWIVTWALWLGDPVIETLLPQLQLESAAKSALVRKALGIERDSHAPCIVCKAPPAAPCYDWCTV